MVTSFFTFRAFTATRIQKTDRRKSETKVRPYSNAIRKGECAQSPVPRYQPAFPPLESSVNRLCFLLTVHSTSLLPLDAYATPLCTTPFALFMACVFCRGHSAVDLQYTRLFAEVSLLPVCPHAGGPCRRPRHVRNVTLRLSVRVYRRSRPARHRLIPYPIANSIRRRRRCTNRAR